MRIKLENIKEGQVVYFVYAKRRIAKVRAYYYDSECDEFGLGDGNTAIHPASKLKFYDKRVDAARELMEYHDIEYLRYSNMVDQLERKLNGDLL